MNFNIKLNKKGLKSSVLSTGNNINLFPIYLFKYKKKKLFNRLNVDKTRSYMENIPNFSKDELVNDEFLMSLYVELLTEIKNDNAMKMNVSRTPISRSKINPSNC